MKITNFTELSNFLNNNNISAFGQNLINCTNEYGRICGCRRQQKEEKLNECNTYYINTINNMVQNKDSVLSDSITSIEFYKDGVLLGSISK